MTTRNTLSWRPTDEAARKILAAFAAGGALIGLVGFSVSFASVSQAARPYLGWASWTLPTLVDLGIFVLSGLALFLELHEISSKLIRLIPTALAGFTVYLNTAEQPTVFGKAVHAAGPLLWIAVVEIATFTVRRLVDLASESAMEKVRASRWLLAPLSTFRLWRRMRLWELTSYRVAIGREHERSASRALLRQWYGFGWKAKAPRGERLAVRLQGVTAEPVAELLTRASAGITAAAMAATKPVMQGAEPVEVAVPEASAQAVPEPSPKRTRTRTSSAPRKRVRAVPEARSEAQLLAEASALNEQAIAATGQPVSLRKLKAEMHVGQPVAERLRAALQAVPEVHPRSVPVGVPVLFGTGERRPVEFANGSAA
jgi:hypothetical protein